MQVTLLLNDPSSFSFARPNGLAGRACPKEKKQPACAGRKKKAPRSKTHLPAVAASAKAGFRAKRTPDNYNNYRDPPCRKMS